MTTLLTPVDTTDAADWFVSALSDNYTVDGLVPPQFAAYIRILHPAYGPHDERPVPWSEVAKMEGTTLHPLSSFEALVQHKSKHRSRWDISDPAEGSLDDKRLAILAGILAEHTTTPDTVWLNVWDGFGGTPKSWLDHPRVVQGDGYREYYLFRCALEQVLDASVGFAQWPDDDDRDGSSFVITAEYVGDGDPPEDPPPHPDAPGRLIQSPQQWWPEDHAWAVATEIDDDYTVVAGSEELIAAILAHPGLEAFRVGPHASWEDTVNRP